VTVQGRSVTFAAVCSDILEDVQSR